MLTGSLEPVELVWIHPCKQYYSEYFHIWSESTAPDGCLMNSQSSRKQTINRGSGALEIPKGKRNLKQITLRHHMTELTCNQFHARFPLSAISGFGFRRFGYVLYRDPQTTNSVRFSSSFVMFRQRNTWQLLIALKKIYFKKIIVLLNIRDFDVATRSNKLTNLPSCRLSSRYTKLHALIG